MSAPKHTHAELLALTEAKGRELAERHARESAAASKRYYAEEAKRTALIAAAPAMAEALLMFVRSSEIPRASGKGGTETDPNRPTERDWHAALAAAREALHAAGVLK